jgi:hypothetical protein
VYLNYQLNACWKSRGDKLIFFLNKLFFEFYERFSVNYPPLNIASISKIKTINQGAFKRKELNEKSHS